jgi:hypothetical protein
VSFVAQHRDPVHVEVSFLDTQLTLAVTAVLGTAVRYLLGRRR